MRIIATAMMRSQTKLPANHTVTPELNLAISAMSVMKKYYSVPHEMLNCISIKEAYTNAVHDGAQSLHQCHLEQISINPLMIRQHHLPQ